ncbi:MAG: hypothetical protein IJ068_01850 [Bacilli bacterium]|nr:hypothetical protein [Bacilli bacterium]
MDAIIFIILLVVVILFFKRLSNTVFFVAIIDILLRILTFIRDNTFQEIKSFISKYFPENIPHIISKYAKGDLYTILVWIYVILMCVFLYYVIRIFIKRKKF